MQKIKAKIILLSSLLVLSIPLAVPVSVSAQYDPNDCIKQGSKLVFPDGTACDPDLTDQGATLTDYLADILNIISIIVGVAAVVMLIVGGFRYVASAGKAESVQGAKNTILYAIIGLVVVALAQVVVQYILKQTLK